MALVPLLYPPTNVDSFEAFARTFYATTNYHDNFMNYSIFSEHLNGTKYHDTKGETTFSVYRVLAPVFEIVDEGSICSIMFNMHSEYNRGRAIDRIIEGWEIGKRNKSSVTPLLQLIQDKYTRPASQMIFPIAPAEDPDVLVGFIRSINNWDTVLELAVPANANGIDIVISDGNTRVTYSVFKGRSIHYLGQGDLCDPQYDSYRYEFTAPIQSGYELYTFVVCPRKEYFSSELLFAPVSSGIFTILLILFVATIIGIHNNNLQRQLRFKQEILDSKQSFVRFISHEIRTPLNAVCMGLKLLMEELEASLIGVEASEDNRNRNRRSFGSNRMSFSQHFPLGTGSEDSDAARGRKRRSVCENSNTAVVEVRKTTNNDIFQSSSNVKGNEKCQQVNSKKNWVDAEKVASWMSVMKEIDDSSNNAVTVLNELLIYDKMDINAVHIERDLHPVWELVNSAVKPFNIQAREKGLRIEINSEVEGRAIDDFDLVESSENNRDQLKDLIVIGDSDRLSQVFKNIVSNAIKFSLPGTTLTITGMWCPSRLITEG